MIGLLPIILGSLRNACLRFASGALLQKCVARFRRVWPRVLFSRCCCSCSLACVLVTFHVVVTVRVLVLACVLEIATVSVRVPVAVHVSVFVRVLVVSSPPRHTLCLVVLEVQTASVKYTTTPDAECCSSVEIGAVVRLHEMCQRIADMRLPRDRQGVT